MLESPEIATIAAQADAELTGRRVQCVTRGNSPHKWFFSNKDEKETAEVVEGQVVAAAWPEAKWLRIRFENGAMLSFNEMGGQIRYFESATEVPAKHHFFARFIDGSALCALVQGWGFLQVLAPGEIVEKPAHQQGPDALGDEFTYEVFAERTMAWPDRKSKSVKAFLTSGYAAAGFGNGYLHDILFKAGVLPTRKAKDLKEEELPGLYAAISEVLRSAADLGGRDVERDLFGNAGRYVPTLDKRAEGKPCPKCGTAIKKLSFQGGSCYFCAECQK